MCERTFHQFGAEGGNYDGYDGNDDGLYEFIGGQRVPKAGAAMVLSHFHLSSARNITHRVHRRASAALSARPEPVLAALQAAAPVAAEAL